MWNPTWPNWAERDERASGSEWRPRGVVHPEDPEASWLYLQGGPGGASEAAFHEERRRQRHHWFAGGLGGVPAGGDGGQWTMGDPGNWANPGAYSGPGSASQAGFGMFGRHLGHPGRPVVQSPDVDARRNFERRYGAGPYTGRGPKGYRRSDERILEEVCEALTEDGEVDATEIEVGVRDGEVLLGGSVRDRRQKRRAEWVAERCLGVVDVHNSLRVGTGEGAKTA